VAEIFLGRCSEKGSAMGEKAMDGNQKVKTKEIKEEKEQ
jgi:hypothetical protein